MIFSIQFASQILKIVSHGLYNYTEHSNVDGPWNFLEDIILKIADGLTQFSISRQETFFGYYMSIISNN